MRIRDPRWKNSDPGSGTRNTGENQREHISNNTIEKNVLKKACLLEAVFWCLWRFDGDPDPHQRITDPNPAPALFFRGFYDANKK